MKQTGIVIILIILFFSGCENDNCFKKAGDISVQRHDFDTIAHLIVAGVFDIELIPDSIYFIEAIAPANMMPSLEFAFTADTAVTCYNYNSCFWRRDYDKPKLKVHGPGIYEIKLAESSYLYSTDTLYNNVRLIVTAGLAEADLILNNYVTYFYINKTSGGRYNFSGKAENASFLNYNTGLMDMSDLIARYGIVKNYSTIDMRVHVTDRIKVTVGGSGHILYKGNPEIVYEEEPASTGRVIPIQ